MNCKLVWHLPSTRKTPFCTYETFINILTVHNIFRLNTIFWYNSTFCEMSVEFPQKILTPCFLFLFQKISLPKDKRQIIWKGSVFHSFTPPSPKVQIFGRPLLWQAGRRKNENSSDLFLKSSKIKIAFPPVPSYCWSSNVRLVGLQAFKYFCFDDWESVGTVEVWT